MDIEEFDKLKYKATERYISGYYDKAYDKGTNDWCILSNVWAEAKIIHSGLTEEEADAFLKLLRS